MQRDGAEVSLLFLTEAGDVRSSTVVDQPLVTSDVTDADISAQVDLDALRGKSGAGPYEAAVRAAMTKSPPSQGHSSTQTRTAPRR